MVTDFNKNLKTSYKKSKAVLDGWVKAYHTAWPIYLKWTGGGRFSFGWGFLAGLLLLLC